MLISESSVCVFDMDGTIVDTLGFWRNAPLRYLEHKGINPDSEDRTYIFSHMMSQSLPFLNDKYSFCDDPEKAEDDLAREVLEEYKTVKCLKEGCENFLMMLKEQKVPACIYTANEREFLDVIISKFSLENYFDHFFTCRELGYHKGERAGFEYIASLYGKNIADIVLFEDSLYAIENARALGMRSVGVREEHSAHVFDEIERYADVFVSSYDELVGLM
ncbi:MAG: HAD family hydrolase [Bullifex sp.]